MKNIQKILLRDTWKSTKLKEDKERELWGLNQSERGRRGHVPSHRNEWLLPQVWPEWQGLGRNSPLSLLPPWRSHHCFPLSNPARSRPSRGLRGWPQGCTQDYAGGVCGGGWHKYRMPAYQKVVRSSVTGIRKLMLSNHTVISPNFCPEINYRTHGREKSLVYLFLIPTNIWGLRNSKSYQAFQDIWDMCFKCLTNWTISIPKCSILFTEHEQCVPSDLYAWLIPSRRCSHSYFVGGESERDDDSEVSQLMNGRAWRARQLAHLRLFYISVPLPLEITSFHTTEAHVSTTAGAAGHHSPAKRFVSRDSCFSPICGSCHL